MTNLITEPGHIIIGSLDIPVTNEFIDKAISKVFGAEICKEDDIVMFFIGMVDTYNMSASVCHTRVCISANEEQGVIETTDGVHKLLSLLEECYER